MQKNKKIIMMQVKKIEKIKIIQYKLCEQFTELKKIKK